MPTPLLNITTIATGSASKEALISQAMAEIEQSLAETEVIDLSAGNVTLTTTNWNRNIVFYCSGHSVSRDLIVPLTKKLFCVINLGTASIAVKGATGTTSVVVASSSALLSCDGVNINLIANAANIPSQDITIVEVTASTQTPTTLQNRNYFRCTNATSCTVTIPTNASQAFPIGASLIYEQSSSGQVTINGDTGVTINVVSTNLSKTAGTYAVVQLVKTGTDAWTIFGNLEAV